MEKEKLILNGITYRILYSRKAILKRVKKLAHKIAENHENDPEPPILLLVLTGGLYLGVDLSRALDEIGFKHQIDTIGLKRYNGDEQGGMVRILSLPRLKLGKRKIIVVEDLVDQGATMNYLNQYLKDSEVPPESIEYCTLLLKNNHQPLKFEINYLGWLSSPKWVAGNGMDSEGLYRGLSAIYIKE